MNIEILDWDQASEDGMEIRRRVFIEEQQVPESLEWDEEDQTSRHALVYNGNGKIVGYARLTASAQLGRMAVLVEYRHQGVGSALLTKLEDEARVLRYPALFLHAQIQALPFYQHHGYHVVGERFYEAGIPHLKMIKQLRSKL